MSRLCYGWIPQEQLSKNQNADQAINLILEPYLAAPFCTRYVINSQRRISLHQVVVLNFDK